MNLLNDKFADKKDTQKAIYNIEQKVLQKMENKILENKKKR